MKWQNVVLPSSSGSNAKLKRRDYANSITKSRVSSNVTRPGMSVLHIYNTYMGPVLSPREITPRVSKQSIQYFTFIYTHSHCPPS